MQKVKQFFIFIFGKDVKEILIRVILIQVIILLFIAMSGNFEIKVSNRGYIDIDSVDGSLDIDIDRVGGYISIIN